MSVSNRIPPFALALSLACMVGAARANVVYDQPSSGAACDSSCWTSTSAQGGGYQTFDNFTLSADATITKVSWTGFFYDYLDGAANPVTPPDQIWNVSFYDDDRGTPESQIYSDDLSIISTIWIANSSFDGNQVSLYRFSATLDTPFYATAGVSYWFSPLSEQSDFNPFFSWSPAAVDVDGVTDQAQLPDAPYTRPNDRAFSLSDDAPSGVPEPAAWSLMLLGVAGAGGVLRGDRRAVTSPGRGCARF
jgi:hypothetical protein